MNVDHFDTGVMRLFLENVEGPYDVALISFEEVGLYRLLYSEYKLRLFILLILVVRFSVSDQGRQQAAFQGPGSY